MTTYTIAMLGDMLVATAPDGDAEMMAARVEDTMPGYDPEDRAENEQEISYTSGLTLFQTQEAAEEAGADVVYSGTDMGWLEDAAGEMIYQAAGYVGSSK